MSLDSTSNLVTSYRLLNLKEMCSAFKMYCQNMLHA